MTGVLPRTLRLRFDEAALAGNWRALDAMSGTATAGAAIKADGYGLGAARVVPVLREAGCRNFFVAHWSEVEPMLAHVGPGELAVLHGPHVAEHVALARSKGVRPVINSVRQARLWLEGGGGPCDLMLDTGINRLGLPPTEIGDEAIARLEVETLMSHLASADEDSAQNEEQRSLFCQLAGHVAHKRRSLANSSGIALGSEYAFDLTRPGIALYGGVPRPELAPAIRQVAYPQAAVIQLRDLKAGDRVGYNAAWTADGPTRAATVSIGYADGFLRCRAGQGALQFGGAVLPLLGKISMDMVVVDCGVAQNIAEGDWLDIPFDLPTVSKQTGISQYELLTTLGRRFSTIN
ncbi:alanine racemase [Altererythrobacter salegens]|uniref:alanine racemase n=1 Tax=Croceibacterium salegens TaxID=1737568 RepID=A0A6I4STX7_9SPHN|nr:alanine racemase [Croceibacterium salegens]MXO58838.1 alanine racemase [Croceibacterium salegens]